MTLLKLPVCLAARSWLGRSHFARAVSMSNSLRGSSNTVTPVFGFHIGEQKDTLSNPSHMIG